MKLRIKIALIITTIFTILINQTEAIEIKGIKHYSENVKTRIVIQLSEPAQYKTQFDLEQNIIISLLKTGLNSSVKSSNINDGLVETVTFGNTSDNIINVRILLERPAAFNVFPLEAPARIVIDILPVDNIFKPEVVAISPSGSEESYPQMEKTTPTALTNEDTIISENTEAKKSSADDSQKTNDAEGILNTGSETKSSKSILTDTKSFIDYGFNIVVLITLIYMVFKIREVSKFVRIIRKNIRTIKENPDFATVETQDINDEEKDNISETVTIPKQYKKVEEMAQRD